MSDSADFELDYDLSNTKAWDGNGGGPNVDPGEYALELTEVEKGTSNAGKPVLKITFTVVSEGPFNGQKFARSYSLTQAALGRVTNLVMACGARLDKIRREDYLGRIIEATIIHTEAPPQAAPDGTMRAARSFIDVINERPLEGQEQPAVKAAPAPAAAPAKTGNGVRRAVGPAQAR